VFRSSLSRCGVLIIFDLVFLICWGLLFKVNRVFSVTCVVRVLFHSIVDLE